MPRGTLIALTKPTSPECEDEYNEWYDQVHLGEVAAVAGVVSAKRYKIAAPSALNQSADSPFANPYLAVYELDAPDLESLAREIDASATDGRFQMSDALHPNPTVVLYEQL